MPDPFNEARSRQTNAGDQERNRLWWEELPMTYAEWGLENRDIINDWDNLNKKYLEGNPWLMEQFGFERFAGKRVLEIGCGAGTASTLFAKMGAQITGVDLTEKAVQLTAENARVQGLSLDVRQADAESLPFDNETFDFVYSWGVLHHSHCPDKAYREVARVLKGDGKGLVMVYNSASLRYWIKGVIWLFGKGAILKGDNIHTVQRHYTDGYYHKHYTPSQLSKDLRSAGLATEKISVTHMGKKMLPLIPVSLDNFLKSQYGWLLISEFRKA